VVPLASSTTRQYSAEVLIRVGGQHSNAIADQLMVADKAWLKSQWILLSRADMLTVQHDIKLHLGLLW